MSEQRKFWKGRPAPLWRDLRALSLAIPAAAACLGAVAYAAQGFAVSNGGVLPSAWVEEFTHWGSLLLAIGCEGGTLSAVVEVSRKQRDGDLARIDAIGVAVSFVATITARLLSLSQINGSLAFIVALVLTSAADAYVLFNELGDYAAIRLRRPTVS